MRRCMFDKIDRKPYPLDQFLWLSSQTAFEVLEKMQAPDPLIGMTINSAMTIACQGLADAMDPRGKLHSLNQNFLMVFESGLGKTLIKNLLFKPFIDSDKAARIKFDSELEQFAIEIEPWDAKYKGFYRAITKATSKGESTTELEAQLAEHMKLKPKTPKLHNFLHYDMTYTSLTEILQGMGISVAYTTDEGDEAFQGDIMSSPGGMNRVWDAPEYMPRDRGNRNNTASRDPRVSVSIMTQYEPLKKYLNKRGSLAKGSGHLARYLIGGSNKKKGYRKIQRGEQVWTWLPEFHTRISKFLDRYLIMLESGKIEREILEFTDDAKARWFDIAQKIENNLRDGAYLNDITDFASKMMDIVTKLAATMHYFSEQTSNITVDTLERAFKIVLWHVDEFKYLFSSEFMIPQEELDAHDEAEWLHEKHWKGIYYDVRVSKSAILNRGITRNAKRLDAALNLLAERGAIRYVGSLVPGDRTQYIQLMNHYFATL